MSNDSTNASGTEALTIRLPVDQIAELKERATENYRPISHEVRRALAEMFEREPREKQAA